MELTDSFLTLLQSFDPVFTAPTYQTLVVIVTGWILSQRHRYVTEVIFSSGHVGDGHWSRFHRFFSHAAWDIDFFSMHLTKLVVGVIPKSAHAALRLDCFLVEACVTSSSCSSITFNSARHSGGVQRQPVRRSLAIASRVCSTISSHRPDTTAALSWNTASALPSVQ